MTGKKRLQKIYRRHSGRPGGMTEEKFDDLQQRIPERIVEHAVKGMLPKGRVSHMSLNCTTSLLVFAAPKLWKHAVKGVSRIS